MYLIQNNPYRIAGILSNAKAREIEKQKAKIKAYIKVGKEKEIILDYDFDVLQNLRRTEESIKKAFSSVQLNQDKVDYALFWFLNASPIDNTAIEYLKKGNEEKAVEIWEKVTLNKEVNSKNFSAFNNLGTYKLLSESEDEIKAGIEAKIKLIESDYFENFVHSVADETFTIDNEKQIKKLVDELLTQFKNQYSSSDTLQLFSGCSETTQKYLLAKLTEEPINNIESKVESTKNKRKENQHDAYKFGLQLYKSCKKDLAFLKSIRGKNDLKYKMTADNLANEVMQCGIDYFRELQDHMDPSEEALELLKNAKSIAMGSQMKDRVKENIEGIQEWTKTSKAASDIAVVAELLVQFETDSDSLINARALIIASKTSLNNIKNVLGPTDEFYLNVSSAVVNNSLQMVIEVVNEAQRDLEHNSAKLLTLPITMSSAVSVVDAIGSLDMNAQTRKRYSENKSIISSIVDQLKTFRSQTSTSRGRGSRSSSYPQSSTSNSSSWAEENPGCLIILIIIGIIILVNIFG